MKLFLAEQKRTKPKDATDSVRKALAGGETMLEGLNRVEAQVAEGFDPVSTVGIAWGAAGQIPFAGVVPRLFAEESRREFNANYDRIIEGIVQAAAGVASDQDVSRMMNLYRPKLGDSDDVFKRKYVSLLNDARGLFLRVAGKTGPGRQNEEQQFGARMAEELKLRIQRIEAAEGFEGFSPIAGRGQPGAAPPPAIDFDTADLGDIEASLGGL